MARSVTQAEVAAQSGERRRLMLVELNEFDPEFLGKAADRHGLRNIARVLTMRRSATTTDDQVEHQGLDPWVQWVNVHSGQPSSKHGIRRLGQTARQTAPQIWSKLGDAGRTWGIWGAMNAPRQDAAGCKFFFPDPWSFEEQAYPEKLNELLALPRYAARNYLDADRIALAKESVRFIAALADPALWKSTAVFTRDILAYATTKGLSVHAKASFLDYLSTLIFVSLRKKLSPDFSLIFLNNIAHLQHQFWLRGEDTHPEMALGLQLTDKMLGLLLHSLGPDEALIVMNGLKQKNVEGEGFCVYRQKNPQRFIERLGLSGSVEQCMTHDAHVLHSTPADADKTERVLRSCRLASGDHAFYVERVSELSVFYQINFEHEIASDERLLFGNDEMPLAEAIELYARRTGAHIPDADLFSRGIELPSRLKNHTVFDFVLQHFGLTMAEGADMAAHQFA